MKNRNLILILVVATISVLSLLIAIFSVLSYYFPDKRDYNCSDFTTRDQMLMIWRQGGGPNRDPYHLARGTDKTPCKELQ